MTDLTLYQKITSLPDSVKKEVDDFIEFVIQKNKGEKESKNHPKAGFLKGTFKVSDDFDEPLDDFKDYM